MRKLSLVFLIFLFSCYLDTNNYYQGFNGTAERKGNDTTGNQSDTSSSVLSVEQIMRKKEDDRRKKEEQIREKRYEKIVGYKFCSERYIVPFVGMEFPKNCIFRIPEYFIVSQQISDGTLVREALGNLSFFITKNNVDAAMADRSIIKTGYFVRTGNYQYMSLMGVRTVQKLKRLPDM